ncbi:LysR substrate-binding domain-containing protein [Rhodococcus sp. MALMAid1271]|uniref:LysR substrate-binding domain-containing protein n=1 Tax=Rhodococcus sp. MALMAid1271 TaxID=3411744 RepID=UPI003B9ED96F
MGIDRYAVVPVESDLAGATHLTPDDLGDRPCIEPVGQPGLAAWAAGSYPRHGVRVRSPLNIPSAVAMSGTVGVYAEPARRYLPNPDVRYIELDGPQAIIALASRPEGHRESVDAFRRAVQAASALEALAGTTGQDEDTPSVQFTAVPPR